MFQQLHATLTNAFQRYTKKCVNRTGATLTKGQVVALDITGSDGDVQTYAAWYALASGARTDTKHPFANVIPVAAAQLNGWGMFLVATETIADDALGIFGVSGVFDVAIAAGDGSSAAIVNGGIGRPTDAQTYLSAASDGNVSIAQLLEDGPVPAAVANAKCVFQGVCQFNTNGG